MKRNASRARSMSSHTLRSTSRDFGPTSAAVAQWSVTDVQ